MRSKDTSALPRLPLLVRKHFFLYIPPPSLPVPPPMYSVAETLVTRTLHRLDSGTVYTNRSNTEVDSMWVDMFLVRVINSSGL